MRRIITPTDAHFTTPIATAFVTQSKGMVYHAHGRQQQLIQIICQPVGSTPASLFREDDVEPLRNADNPVTGYSNWSRHSWKYANGMTKVAMIYLAIL